MISGVFWREILPCGAPINGEHMPAGYDVGTGIYAVHHNPNCYPKPFVYDPSRWLIDYRGSVIRGPCQSCNAARSSPSVTDHGRAFARPLAYLEMTLAVARVLWAADIRTAGEEKRVEWVKGIRSWAGVGTGSKSTSWCESKCRSKIFCGADFPISDQMTSAKEGPFVEFRKRKC